MVNFPTRVYDCDFHIPALWDLSFSSDVSICSTMAFPSLENSNHIIVPDFTDLLSNSKGDAPFIVWLMTILVLIEMIFVII